MLTLNAPHRLAILPAPSKLSLAQVALDDLLANLRLPATSLLIGVISIHFDMWTYEAFKDLAYLRCS